MTATSIVQRAVAVAGLAALFCASTAVAQTAAPKGEPRRPDVIFVPTPEDVVEEMLKVANVTGKVRACGGGANQQNREPAGNHTTKQGHVRSPSMDRPILRVVR